MIVSSFERKLVDDWAKYAGNKIAVDMLIELRDEAKISNSFGVIWNMDLPEWAIRAQNGDFKGVRCLKKVATGVAR